MWLRMVNHYSKSSLETLPNFTGKTWNEWVDILSNDPESRCGIPPLIEYLMTTYDLAPECAQTIAIEYVMGHSRQDA